MTSSDPHILLEELRCNLRKIKQLAAWQDLKRAERSDRRPPAFEMYDPTVSDLNIEYSRFIAAFSNLQITINGSKLRTIKLVRIRREYLSLRQEFDSLDIPSRLKSLW